MMIKTRNAVRAGTRIARSCPGDRCSGSPAWRRSPALPARAAELVTFADLTVADDQYTEKARKLAGKTVEMHGYMAPPLKPEIDFFVLTSLPTAICPFCDAAASWPDDIVLVNLSRPVRALAYDRLLDVSGILEIGIDTDEATGFVSLVRLRDAKYTKV